MTDLVKGKICIDADMAIIQQVLIQHQYIKEWEKGFDSFKELHVFPGLQTIVHWDVEQDVDYIYQLSAKENTTKISLSMIVKELLRFSVERQNESQLQIYVHTVLTRIKDLSEKLHIEEMTLHCTN